jgi:hypothetical protein
VDTGISVFILPLSSHFNHMSDEAISKPPEHENIKEKPQEQPGRNPWGFRIRLFFALVLPIFMETLDYTIVATAQPHIAVSILHQIPGLN